MLPLDYLRVVRRGALVRPRYLEDLAVVREVLEAAKSSRTVGEFRKKAEEIPADKKLTAGLVHIVEARLKKEEVDKRLVTRVRAEVFKTAASRWPVLNDEARQDVFATVANKLKLDVKTVEELFLKAYEDNLAILEPPPAAPEDLAKEYNLALIQTLLFKSLYVKAWVPNSPAVVKRLIRAVKGYRLMYLAEEAGEGLMLYFDGPVSALRQTERYGTRLAKLVPYIISAGRWKIEAEVKLGERTYTFKEDWQSAPPLPAVPTAEEEFDSSIEQEFYRQVSRVCHVEREPEVLVVDRRVYIPDFKIGDLYIEVVGFWTADYLKRKYEKLVRVKKPLLVLVSEELAMATWKELLPNVVLFKDRPRLSDVYKYIKPYCVSNNRREAMRFQ
ncbi:MAG: DUF790 family protein [Pyrobaculum sp.]